uniref:NADH-ubiquinone oxidoreductase chain 3 n=1 Tax=Knipolegus cyanirostris TaxID=478605 RepID=H9X950_9TYRA|nr:NADH dehydrogenase subunit 3 [Knipolegus cyanirostris]AFG70793.1 NADH dehydrogenase subunit 3 [Knipolegus cyanirostris]
MNMILFMFILSSSLSIILTMLNLWLAQTNPDSEKLSPYECGFDPLGSARLPFSIRFFLVAILFLLFDLEIALLLPLPWATQLQSPLTTLTWASIMLLLLTLGLIYEWAQGGLEWAE